MVVAGVVNTLVLLSVMRLADDGQKKRTNSKDKYHIAVGRLSNDVMV